MPQDLISVIKTVCKDVCTFAFEISGIKLREYQKAVANAIVRSVFDETGLSFVVMFPRQSGKNELQAQIEAYIMTVLSQAAPSSEIVKVSPTWKPQSLNAMRRLQRVLERNLLAKFTWKKESGYIYRNGQVRIFFLSGSPEANIVGATASTLLEVDEAQDVDASKFDKEIAPMAASTNATRVFWGTAWTSNTLLARELRAAQAAQARDGVRRVFRIGADDVAMEVPAYGKFVAEQVARLGRTHPMVRTQFFSEEIDAEGSLFSNNRISILNGTHSAQGCPQNGQVIIFLLDVAGQDEQADLDSQGATLSNPKRDSTALTILHVDTSTCADPLLNAPTYRVLCRHLWTGVDQTQQYAAIRGLVDVWNPRHLVVDATGIGAGLASFLGNALPGRVIPFTFNASSKSKLCWSFLAIIDAGRWKEPSSSLPFREGPGVGPLRADITMTELFYQQLQAVQYQIQPGPQKLIKWSVPDGTRDPATGELIHDDLVMSAALVGEIDAMQWSAPGAAVIVQRSDPLKEYDRGF